MITKHSPLFLNLSELQQAINRMLESVLPKRRAYDRFHVRDRASCHYSK